MAFLKLLFVVLLGYVYAGPVEVALEKYIDGYFLNQGRTVTYSIKWKHIPPNQSFYDLVYPDPLYEGSNRLTVYKTEALHKVFSFTLYAKERLPVAGRYLASAVVLAEADLEYAWFPLHKIPKSAIREISELFQAHSKYVKKRGTFFYEGDVRKPYIIHRNDPCVLHVNLNQVQISVPATALKNGALGSRIRVLNRSTKKILEARVMNSRNVEVILN